MVLVGAGVRGPGSASGGNSYSNSLNGGAISSKIILKNICKGIRGCKLPTGGPWLHGRMWRGCRAPESRVRAKEQSITIGKFRRENFGQCFAM